MNKRYEAALTAAQELCVANGSTLLFLTVFGSELYGTNTGNSDLDVRGLFLPSLQSLILGQARKSIHYSSGAPGEKNSTDDCDIDLWSLDYWLFNLLPAGDTGALDLLFSTSNSHCVILQSSLLAPIFAHPQKLLNLANNRTYADYSLSQAKKYGIKGSRLGALRAVWKWLEANKTEGKLFNYIEAILKDCGHEKYCFHKLQSDKPALVLCGKIYMGTIKMEEFKERVYREMEKFGERAKAAELNEGLDFKALSHAMRALEQMEELFLTGKIEFPLRNRNELIKIKKGEIPWAKLEELIIKRLEEINRLYEKLSAKFNFQREFAEKILLNCYGFTRPSPSEDIFKIVSGELEKIEREYRVKILFAAESGSRAWGFPSLDSDYDIRFIYVHDKDWYLGAAPEKQRNVVEKNVMIPDFGLLDMSGWELRKTLNLLQGGNPQIAEWLFSPMVYRDITDFSAIIRKFLPKLLSMGGMYHHYFGLMHNSYKKIVNGNHSAKAILYVIRPLLILLWLQKDLGLPPVPLDDLIDKLIDRSDVRNQIKWLIEIKRYGREHDNDGDLAGREMMEWISLEYERLKTFPPQLDYKREKIDADTIFRTLLEQSQSLLSGGKI